METDQIERLDAEFERLVLDRLPLQGIGPAFQWQKRRNDGM